MRKVKKFFRILFGIFNQKKDVSFMTELKNILLTAPDGHLDKSVFPLIEKWDEPPKSIQVLEVLDNCIHGSLASGFVVGVLQKLYEEALENDKTTHEKNVPLATWRNR
jgi:hypothetical protein